MKLYTSWIAIFSLHCGLFLMSILSGELFYLPYFILCLFATVALIFDPIVKTKEIPNGIREGIIYILRRSDGVLKFGKTHDLRSRIRGHRNDYRAGFDIVSFWVVPDVVKYEAMILDLTKSYVYAEDNRRELRQMPTSRLSKLIFDFTKEVHQGWAQ